MSRAQAPPPPPTARAQLADLLDPTEVAALLRLTSSTSVRKLVQRGELTPAGRGARNVSLFRPEDVLALVELRGRQYAQERGLHRAGGCDDREGRKTQVKGAKDLANGVYLVRARGWD